MYKKLLVAMGDRVDWHFNGLTISNGVEMFQISYNQTDYIVDATGLYQIVCGKTAPYLRKVAQLPRMAQKIVNSFTGA